MLEACVGTAAAVAAELIAARHPVGIIANGVPPGDRARLAVPPAAGTRQLATILEALARVQPIVVKPLSALIPENTGRMLPAGATAICVAGTGSQALPATLGALSACRCPTLLVEVLDSSDPSGENIRISRHRPDYRSPVEAVAG